MQSEDGVARPVGRGPQCPDCEAALQSADRQAVSFLLIETLTVPLIGCEAHLEAFRAICELSTDGAAKLLSHLPAGGIQCPGCRGGHHSPGVPIIPVEAGAVGVLACGTHAEELLNRFQSGLQARHQLGVDGPL